MDMCRFSGCDDMEYRKVAAALDHIQMRLTEASAKPALLLGSCAAFDPPTVQPCRAGPKAGENGLETVLKLVA